MINQNIYKYNYILIRRKLEIGDIMNNDILYIKASGEFPRENGKAFFFSDLKEGTFDSTSNETNEATDQGFRDHHRIREVIIHAKRNTLCILHDTKRQLKYRRVNDSRLCGIGVVQQEYKTTKDNSGYITIRKIIELPRAIPLKTLKEDDRLRNAAPFHDGSNRCTIVEIDEKAYSTMRTLILRENPEIESRLRILEKNCGVKGRA